MNIKNIIFNIKVLPLLSLILIGDVFADSLPVLILNNTNLPPYSTKDASGSIDKVAKEAFRRVGVDVHLLQQPPERGLLNANSGKLDGDLSRIDTISKFYPNLVKVPEVLMQWKFTAFSKSPYLDRDWKYIKNNSVAYIKGWKIYENKLKRAEFVTEVGNAEQLFELLSLGRVDTVLYERWMGISVIKKMGFNDIHAYSNNLETRNMYIHLYKSHAGLVPKLSKSLKELKKEGFYKKETLQ